MTGKSAAAFAAHRSLARYNMVVRRHLSRNYLAEDQIVAELARLGVGYLSPISNSPPLGVYPPDQLLADLIRQPSSRVRSALIPLLIAYPEYQSAIFKARARLRGSRLKLFEVFYTAAVLLQKKYRPRLIELQGESYQELADLFSTSLGVPTGLSPEESLVQLAVRHKEMSGLQANWAGTYENALRHWLRFREKERQWSPSTQLP